VAETDPDFTKALDSVARWLAMRDHSVFELKTKLSRQFEDNVISTVLAEAEARGYLLPEEQIAKRLSEALSRRGKSAGYISAELRKRHLPEQEISSEDELEKARQLLVKKFGAEKLSYEDRAKAYRFLKYRGFDDQWIRKAINNEQP
jgi:SOS response regulatory protein OraA/RecX